MYIEKGRSRQATIAILALTLTFAVMSCASPNTSTQDQEITIDTTMQLPSTIQSLEVNISKIYPTVGIAFWFKPQDADLASIEVEGTLDITLWYQQNPDINNVVKKGEIIQEWKNISLTKEMYSPLLGAAITLEYNDNVKTLELNNIYGILEVRLSLTDGTILTCEETYVKISEQYSC